MIDEFWRRSFVRGTLFGQFPLTEQEIEAQGKKSETGISEELNIKVAWSVVANDGH